MARPVSAPWGLMGCGGPLGAAGGKEAAFPRRTKSRPPLAEAAPAASGRPAETLPRLLAGREDSALFVPRKGRNGRRFPLPCCGPGLPPVSARRGAPLRASSPLPPRRSSVDGQGGTAGQSVVPAPGFDLSLGHQLSGPSPRNVPGWMVSVSY